LWFDRAPLWYTGRDAIKKKKGRRMALAPEQSGSDPSALHGTRLHPDDILEWERRDAHIPNWKDGTDAFRQDDVEFPVTGPTPPTSSPRSTSGAPSADERETSLAPGDDRVADTSLRGAGKDATSPTRPRAPRSATS